MAGRPEGVVLTCMDVDRLDITDAHAVRRVIQELKPQVIINAAAYTAVDRAESQPDIAHAVNAGGAANLAEAATVTGARLLHISTDFVFDGAQATPYMPEDEPNPQGVYGKSKLAGEQNVLSICGEQALVLRTAWVYAEMGQNFVKTILRLCMEKHELRIVMDQVGSPTWAKSIAQALWASVAHGLSGVHHWTDAGVASWYDFAVAIQEEALAQGLLQRRIPISPIRTEEYPVPARRPAYSVLDTRRTAAALHLQPVYWRDNLRLMLRNMKNG